MKSLIFLCIILGAVCVTLLLNGYRYPSKPNNQYEIRVYPDYYLLWDGNREVDSIPRGVDKYLDGIIELDNQ